MTNEEFLRSVSLEGEEWRDVVGYEGIYKVSNKGRVASLSRTVDRKRYKFVCKPKLLKDRIGKNGYSTITLCDEYNNQHPASIHYIVASAFIQNPNNYPCIDHINTIRNDNRVENLRWCTVSMNNLNPITRSKMSKSRTGKYFGSYKPVVGVNISDTKDIRFYKSTTETVKDGFCQRHVSSVCRGVRNKHKGYKWMFLSDYENLKSESQRTP